jgi:hypothetical protein
MIVERSPRQNESTSAPTSAFARSHCEMRRRAQGGECGSGVAEERIYAAKA